MNFFIRPIFNIILEITHVCSYRKLRTPYSTTLLLYEYALLKKMYAWIIFFEFFYPSNLHDWFLCSFYQKFLSLERMIVLKCKFIIQRWITLNFISCKRFSIQRKQYNFYFCFRHNYGSFRHNWTFLCQYILQHWAAICCRTFTYSCTGSRCGPYSHYGLCGQYSCSFRRLFGRFIYLFVCI